MPSEPIIHVKDVNKIYPDLGSRVMLRRETIQLIKKTLNKVMRNHTPSPSDIRKRGFQALKDISFDVYMGEGIALVGRNGSGKTTMIRLMANIMRPTSGIIEVHGRYTALIGLGTGFIPDLTGRENIYLNAAIYGVSPKETATLIDEIIDFADIGEAIERRVFEYSSGMRSRLGFSVAAHILPDIVMVDEALAVGDSAFREKCLKKIHSLLEENRTLVLVSHNPDDIRQFCERAIWLHDGEMKMQGAVDHVLKEYETFLKFNPAQAC